MVRRGRGLRRRGAGARRFAAASFARRALPRQPLSRPEPLRLRSGRIACCTTLYDAIHAVALTTAGATSLMHEAKVDVVTVPNLSEHLSSADTTAQLSARFAYAAAMKSINNLLLLGDGETWARQRIDFAGLPEMVRTFLQVAAGGGRHPGDAAARPIAGGPFGHGRERHAQLLRHDLGPPGDRPAAAARASRRADPALRGDQPRLRVLRVPAALADGCAGQGGIGAVEGADDADLRRARAMAGRCDGAARRIPGDRGRRLPQCCGRVRREPRSRHRPGHPRLRPRSAPRPGWPVERRRG